MTVIQKIYLSRHGRSIENQNYLNRVLGEAQKDSSLHQVGEEQSKILGKYLKTQISERERIIFLLSQKRRTLETAEIIAREMGRSIQDEYTNFFCEGNLNERVYQELLIEPDKKSLEEWERWNFHSRVHPEHRGKEYAFKKMEEVGREGIGILHNFAKANYDKTIIAILHGNLNLCMLETIAKNTGKSLVTHMGNCDLYSFERTENGMAIKDFFTNNQLRNFAKE